MFSEKLQDAINQQINRELYSSYLYLAMSAYFEASSYPGFANWTRLQANEEMEHAMKFYDYMNERGGRVMLGAIEQPPAEWNSPVEVFQEILEHERKVTAMINALYEIALAEKDYPTQIMLHWFISEQVEEEASVSAIVDQLRMTEDRKGNLMYIDRHVGKRQAE